MKTNKLVYGLFGRLALASCSDKMDYSETVVKDKDYVIQTFEKVGGCLLYTSSYKGWSVNTQWTGAWNVSRMLDGVFRMPFYNKTSHEMGHEPGFRH